MKQKLRACFVSNTYKRDLFDKLQNLRQGGRLVEEYYKEMEQAMIRTHVHENEEQTLARFLFGINKNIKRIVQYQPYNTVVDLVHQATKAEKQLLEDVKPAPRTASFNLKAPSSSSNATKPHFSLGQGTSSTSTSSNTNARSSSIAKSASISSEKKVAPSPTSLIDATTKSREIQCFKCLGRGNIARECPNNRIMLVTEDG